MTFHGEGEYGPMGWEGPPPRHTREDSRKPEVQKIRNNEKNGTWFGQCMSGLVNSA